MARTISDRLAATAKTSFVGREQELGLLRGAIEARDLPFVVAYIHGIGGIGKTRLLQATLSSLAPEITSIKLDCREIEPTKNGFLQALGNYLNLNDQGNEASSIISHLGEFKTRTVLALDTYETFGLMDTWFVKNLCLPFLTRFLSLLTAVKDPMQPGSLLQAGKPFSVKLAFMNYKKMMPMRC